MQFSLDALYLSVVMPISRHDWHNLDTILSSCLAACRTRVNRQQIAFSSTAADDYSLDFVCVPLQQNSFNMLSSASSAYRRLDKHLPFAMWVCSIAKNVPMRWYGNTTYLVSARTGSSFCLQPLQHRLRYVSFLCHLDFVNCFQNSFAWFQSLI